MKIKEESCLPHCKEIVQTIEHAFLECKAAKKYGQMWENIDDTQKIQILTKCLAKKTKRIFQTKQNIQTRRGKSTFETTNNTERI